MCDTPQKHILHDAGRSIAIRPSIYLEYGLDGVSGDDTVCEVCARGMRFKSRWRFEPYTVLHIAFTFEDGGLRRIEVEAMVVESTAHPGGGHLILLSFIEAPQELHQNISKISAQLVFPPVAGA